MASESPFLRRALALGVLTCSSAFVITAAAETVKISSNTPRFVATTRSAGPVDPSTVMDVSIWLKPHNKPALDLLARQLYDPTSSSYRRWPSKEEFTARFAPTAAEARTVSSFFTSHGLKIAKVGPNNFFVRATGTASAVSSAFHVTLNNYVVKGKTIRANAEDPSIEGEAAALTASVAGLDNAEYTHPLVTTATRPNAPLPPGGVEHSALTAAALPTSDFNPKCFVGTTTQSYTSSGALPKATYTGNKYTPATSGCGYTPANIRTAYNLNALYKEGYDGTGQTIAIIDWCGSPTVMQDANAFSAQFGLPKLTSSNFQIIYTPTPSYCKAPDTEINLDVEWAHAIAPGAAIDLVVPPSASFQDVNQGLFYAVNYQLGNSISGSFGSEELDTSTSVLSTEDLISEIAAVLGISANFSSGDYGDFTYDVPLYIAPSVSAPADSPYATAVGGVSLALNSNGSIAWQAGWGTNENLLSQEGYVPDPPVEDFYFTFGSGGGPSGVFDKPSFQEKLPGTFRQLPDISWVADPFTGAYIAISEPGVTPSLQYSVIGGTSLSCPMFSALWAIANQEAGQPLGQAAPYLYRMPKSTITDIVPVGSKTNVTGTVTDSAGTTKYSALELAGTLENTSTYVSAIWNAPLYEDTAILITFGTDSGLTTASGWDNVTGLGVPNAKAFADYFHP
jgi:subtilase family serine protease